MTGIWEIEIVRTKPTVFRDRFVCDRKHRDEPRLAALAGNPDDAVAHIGKIGGRKTQGLGNAQTGAIEQRHHGGVARRNPRLVG